MPTPDRRRQKKERSRARQDALRAAQRRAQQRRRLVAALVAVALIGGIALAAVIAGDDDETAVDTTATTITGATTVPGETAPETEPATGTGTAPCPPADGSAEQRREFDGAPQSCIDPAKTYRARVTTNKGVFTVEFLDDKAPMTVNNFVFLSRYKYYDGISCHRIIPDFVVQCGDPEGTGSGGPGYTFADELPEQGEYEVGSLAMANSGPDTNGSQFFIVTGPNGVSLPPNYSLFGKVVEGLDVVKAMEAAGTPGAGTPKEPITIESVTIEES